MTSRGRAFFSVPVSTLAERRGGGGGVVGTECEEGFCPDEPIDRKTMAVWTVRLLDGEDPPAVSATRFGDVDPGGFHAAFVERMAELGVTRGCGDGSGFCPDRNVTRAQMAAESSMDEAADEGPVPALRGFYSASLTTADSLVTVGEKALPCRISLRAEVRDAVHVVLSADWVHAGWAAAQVWPDGTRMGAESIGRLRRSVSNSALVELCGQQFDVLDSQGRSILLTDTGAHSRRLLQSLSDRTVIEG